MSSMRVGWSGYFAWLLGRRWAFLITAVGLTLAGVVGSTRVEIDVDIERFFPGGEVRATYDEYQRAFPKEDVRFSVFWEGTGRRGEALFQELNRIADVFENEGLEDIHWLGGVDVADQVEVDGELGLRLRPLVETDSLSDEYVARVLDRHRDDPIYSGYLWNPDQTVFAVHGHLPQAWNEDRRRREVEAAIATRLESAVVDPARLTFTGIPVIRAESPRLLQKDISVFLGGGLVIAFGLLWFVFGRIRLVIFCLASVIPGYVCTLAVMALLGRPVTMLTSFIPIIILVVGVADAIHLVSGVERALIGGPSDPDRARAVVATAFGTLGPPCLFTSLTTAVGFASLAGTRIGIIAEFGVFTAVAILLTFIFSMTLLPVLLSFSGARRRADLRAARYTRWIVEAAVGLIGRGSKPLAWGFAAVSLACLAAGFQLRSNTFMVDDYRERSSIIQDLRRIETAGFGLFQVNIFVKQIDETPLHDPEALAWMHAFEREMEDDPVVTGALGPPEFFGQLRAAFLDGAPGDRAVPRSREEASQLLLLAEFEDEDFMSDVYRAEDGVAQIIFTVRDQGSLTMVPFLERVDRHLAEEPPPVGTAIATGTVDLQHMYTSRLLRSFAPAFVIAGTLILAIMTLMFGSLRQGLLAMIPNLFPLLVILGLMWLGGYDLKPSSILVFSIAFGLAVDDTIHVLARFRAASARASGTKEALEEALREVGPVVLVTSALAAVGFALLMASQFEVLYLIGLVTAVSAVAAVVADLFLLPLVLRASDPRSRRRPMAAGGPAITVAAGLLTVGPFVGVGSFVAAQEQTASPEERRGREIAEEADARDRGWGDVSARLEMILRDEDGDERRRELRFRTLEGIDTGDKTLMIFDYPADLRGTALLTHASLTGGDDQWIYLPALKRVKRIASGSQSGSFMGSEFAYEDIGSQELDKYDYRYLDAETLDSIECYVVERYPVDERSGYDRHVLWYDKEEYRVRRIEYYGRDDSLLKTLDVRGYELYADRFQRPAEMTMLNHRSGRTTILRWDDWEFGTGLTDRDFDSRSLDRAR